MYHKEKDINSEEVRWRINYYLEYLQNIKENSLYETESLSATLALFSSITEGGSLKNASSKAVKLLKAYNVSGKYGFTVRTKRVLWRLWQYKRNHVLHPIITVVGPDGTGKTSTIHLLKNHCLDLRKERFRSFRFKSMFRLLYPLSWWVRLIMNKTNQKRNIVEERFSSAVSSVAFLMITAAYCIILRKEKWLVDRYFYDYYYLGIRNKNEDRPYKTLFSKLFSRIVPRPWLLIVCHCPEQERQTRKPRELRTASANKLYKTYIQQTLKDRALKSVYMSSYYPINDSPKLITQLCKEI